MAAKPVFPGRRIIRSGRSAVLYNVDEAIDGLTVHIAADNESVDLPIEELVRRLGTFHSIDGDSEEFEFHGFHHSDVADGIFRLKQLSQLSLSHNRKKFLGVLGKNKCCQNLEIMRVKLSSAGNEDGSDINSGLSGSNDDNSNCNGAIGKRCGTQTSEPLGNCAESASSSIITGSERKRSTATSATRNNELSTPVFSKFCLPVRSVHSSRIIIPNKRFMDDGEHHTATKKSKLVASDDGNPISRAKRGRRHSSKSCDGDWKTQGTDIQCGGNLLQESGVNVELPEGYVKSNQSVAVDLNCCDNVTAPSKPIAKHTAKSSVLKRRRHAAANKRATRSANAAAVTDLNLFDKPHISNKTPPNGTELQHDVKVVVGLEESSKLSCVANMQIASCLDNNLDTVSQYPAISPTAEGLSQLPACIDKESINDLQLVTDSTYCSSGSIILQKPRLQPTQAAINRSKVALAKSLKRKMAIERRSERLTPKECGQVPSSCSAAVGDSVNPVRFGLLQPGLQSVVDGNAENAFSFQSKSADAVNVVDHRLQDVSLSTPVSVALSSSGSNMLVDLHPSSAGADCDNGAKFTDSVGEELADDATRDSESREAASSGPRIKHVCRRAAVVLGVPATFPPVKLGVEQPVEINLSALPKREKRTLFSQRYEGQESSPGANTSVDTELTKMDTLCPNETSVNLTDEAGVDASHGELIEQPCSKAPDSKSVGRRRSEPSKRRPRTVRCGNCVACLSPECGSCYACRDMIKNNGPGILKKACIQRTCLNRPAKRIQEVGGRSRTLSEMLVSPKAGSDNNVSISNLHSQMSTTSSASSLSQTNPSTLLKLPENSLPSLHRDCEQSFPVTGGACSLDRQASETKAQESSPSSPKNSIRRSRRHNFVRHRKAKVEPPDVESQERSFIQNENCSDMSLLSHKCALISSRSMWLHYACLICGSLGRDPEDSLVFCAVCCEPFHLYCLPKSLRPRQSKLTWCCAKCQHCHVCGLRNSMPLMQCIKCELCYHEECLGPTYPYLPSSGDQYCSWQCAVCTKRLTLSAIMEMISVRKNTSDGNKTVTGDTLTEDDDARIPFSRLSASGENVTSDGDCIMTDSSDHAYSFSARIATPENVDGSSFVHGTFGPFPCKRANKQPRNHDEQSLCDSSKSPEVKQRTESPGQVNASLDVQECNAEESNENDQRTCELCLRRGDRTAKDDSGRLLYFGENRWVHVACAFWSVGVVEKPTGILHHVGAALSRARKMHCRVCCQRGASVRCSFLDCVFVSHYHCASSVQCIFRYDTNKKVFCSFHRHSAGGRTTNSAAIDLNRHFAIRPRRSCRVLHHYNVPPGLGDPDSISFLLGSLSVHSFGKLSILSDGETHLHPVGYCATRVYWSTVDARRRCMYTCRIVDVSDQTSSPSPPPLARNCGSSDHGSINMASSEKAPGKQVSSYSIDDYIDEVIDNLPEVAPVDCVDRVIDILPKVAEASVDCSESSSTSVSAGDSCVDKPDATELHLMNTERAEEEEEEEEKEEQMDSEHSTASVEVVEASVSATSEDTPQRGPVTRSRSSGQFVCSNFKTASVKAKKRNSSYSGTTTANIQSESAAVSVETVEGSSDTAKPCENNGVCASSTRDTAGGRDTRLRSTRSGSYRVVQLDGTAVADGSQSDSCSESDLSEESSTESEFSDDQSPPTADFLLVRRPNDAAAAATDAVSAGKEGAYKCPKCRQVYRTAQSCSIHAASCNFEVSSSSVSTDCDDACRAEFNSDCGKNGGDYFGEDDDDDDDEMGESGSDDDEDDDENDISHYLVGVGQNHPSEKVVHQNEISLPVAKCSNPSLPAFPSAVGRLMRPSEGCVGKDGTATGYPYPYSSKLPVAAGNARYDDVSAASTVESVETVPMEDISVIEIDGVEENELRPDAFVIPLHSSDSSNNATTTAQHDCCVVADGVVQLYLPNGQSQQTPFIESATVDLPPCESAARLDCWKSAADVETCNGGDLAQQQSADEFAAAAVAAAVNTQPWWLADSTNLYGNGSGEQAADGLIGLDYASCLQNLAECNSASADGSVSNLATALLSLHQSTLSNNGGESETSAATAAAAAVDDLALQAAAVATLKTYVPDLVYDPVLDNAVPNDASLMPSGPLHALVGAPVVENVNFNLADHCRMLFQARPFLSRPAVPRNVVPVTGELVADVSQGQLMRDLSVESALLAESLLQASTFAYSSSLASSEAAISDYQDVPADSCQPQILADADMSGLESFPCESENIATTSEYSYEQEDAGTSATCSDSSLLPRSSNSMEIESSGHDSNPDQVFGQLVVPNPDATLSVEPAAQLQQQPKHDDGVDQSRETIAQFQQSESSELDVKTVAIPSTESVEVESSESMMTSSVCDASASASLLSASDDKSCESANCRSTSEQADSCAVSEHDVNLQTSVGPCSTAVGSASSQQHLHNSTEGNSENAVRPADLVDTETQLNVNISVDVAACEERNLCEHTGNESLLASSSALCHSDIDDCKSLSQAVVSFSPNHTTFHSSSVELSSTMKCVSEPSTTDAVVSRDPHVATALSSAEGLHQQQQQSDCFQTDSSQFVSVQPTSNGDEFVQQPSQVQVSLSSNADAESPSETDSGIVSQTSTASFQEASSESSCLIDSSLKQTENATRQSEVGRLCSEVTAATAATASLSADKSAVNVSLPGLVVSSSSSSSVNVQSSVVISRPQSYPVQSSIVSSSSRPRPANVPLAVHFPEIHKSLFPPSHSTPPTRHLLPPVVSCSPCTTTQSVSFNSFQAQFLLSLSRSEALKSYPRGNSPSVASPVTVAARSLPPCSVISSPSPIALLAGPAAACSGSPVIAKPSSVFSSNQLSTPPQRAVALPSIGSLMASRPGTLPAPQAPNVPLRTSLPGNFQSPLPTGVIFPPPPAAAATPDGKASTPQLNQPFLLSSTMQQSLASIIETQLRLLMAQARPSSATSVSTSSSSAAVSSKETFPRPVHQQGVQPPFQGDPTAVASSRAELWRVTSPIGTRARFGFDKGIPPHPQNLVIPPLAAAVRGLNGNITTAATGLTTPSGGLSQTRLFLPGSGLQSVTNNSVPAAAAAANVQLQTQSLGPFKLLQPCVPVGSDNVVQPAVFSPSVGWIPLSEVVNRMPIQNRPAQPVNVADALKLLQGQLKPSDQFAGLPVVLDQTQRPRFGTVAEISPGNVIPMFINQAVRTPPPPPPASARPNAMIHATDVQHMPAPHRLVNSVQRQALNAPSLSLPLSVRPPFASTVDLLSVSHIPVPRAASTVRPMERPANAIRLPVLAQNLLSGALNRLPVGAAQVAAETLPQVNILNWPPTTANSALTNNASASAAIGTPIITPQPMQLASSKCVPSTIDLVNLSPMLVSGGLPNAAALNNLLLSQLLAASEKPRPTSTGTGQNPPTTCEPANSKWSSSGLQMVSPGVPIINKPLSQVPGGLPGNNAGNSTVSNASIRQPFDPAMWKFVAESTARIVQQQLASQVGVQKSSTPNLQVPFINQPSLPMQNSTSVGFASPAAQTAVRFDHRTFGPVLDARGQLIRQQISSMLRQHGVSVPASSATGNLPPFGSRLPFDENLQRVMLAHLLQFPPHNLSSGAVRPDQLASLSFSGARVLNSNMEKVAAENLEKVTTSSCLMQHSYLKAGDNNYPEVLESTMPNNVDDAEDDSFCSPLLTRYLEQVEKEASSKPKPISVSRLQFEIESSDGFFVRADSCEDAWKAVTDAVEDARERGRMQQITLAGLSGVDMFGLAHDIVQFLIERLPDIEKCQRYQRKYQHEDTVSASIKAKKAAAAAAAELESGCVRAEPYRGRKQPDMFSFLLSSHRRPPREIRHRREAENMAASKVQRRHSAAVSASVDMPMTMRFRQLRSAMRETVTVYRSEIHGRGLFACRDIETGDMIIEYAGEVIRSVLTDRREQAYEHRRMTGGGDSGCYMFRLSDSEVVDATLAGNAARFINHSCEPNCYSRVVDDGTGRKHIVIFALRPIQRGEELTYDYKFPLEDIKIACMCASRRCKKYMN